MQETDITAVRERFCLERRQRGCDEVELQYLNSLVEQKYHYLHVPESVAEATTMYMYLIRVFVD